jgi:phosphoribosylformimino-5-aminoimidazole carboxamide ribotide isomerase
MMEQADGARESAAGIFRVIPGIDVYRGRAVRLRQGIFQDRTDHGDPAQAAESFARAGFRLLHVIDLEGAQLGAFRHLDVMARIVSAVSDQGCRVQFGGGARSVGAIDAALSVGAARVVVGSLLLDDEKAPEQLFSRFGDRILPAVDVKAGKVAVSGWTQETRLSPEEAVQFLSAAGFRKFLMTSVDRDGTGEGPDLSLYERVLAACPSARILASGGVAGMEDLSSLCRVGAEGAVVGRAFYDGAIVPREAARLIRRDGA